MTIANWARLALILTIFTGMTIHSIATGDVAGAIIFSTCLVVYGGTATILLIQLRRDEQGRLNQGV